jgi:hypothetical protein
VKVVVRTSKRNKSLMILTFFISLILLVHTSSTSGSGVVAIYSVVDQKHSVYSGKTNSLSQGTAWKATDYASFSTLTRYWLKLGRIDAKSSITIYMGFASKTTSARYSLYCENL